jgi:hypothetical protein
VFQNLWHRRRLRSVLPHHKEGRALRTETTINDLGDFDIGKRLSNFPALRRIGFFANRRLLDVQRISHDCALGEDAFRTFNRILRPGLAQIVPLEVLDDTSLRRGFDKLQALIDRWMEQTKVPA